MTPAPHDPFLSLDLHGVRLIEASAGTGKTYTLATLVARLVIERGLRVGAILAVTFTEAATQELRERLRRRLLLAARIAGDDPALDATNDDAERTVTRALIVAQRAHESPLALRARLRQAAREIDLAPVLTIHGFCARVLAEHALDAGQPFLAPEMIGSDRALRDEVSVDLWRALGADPVDAALLPLQWPGGPEMLADDLGHLLQTPRLLPPAPPVLPDPLPALQRATDALRAAHRQHGAEARAALDAAIAAKVIDGRKARAASYDKAWHALADGLASGLLSGDDDHLDKLTPSRLQACAKDGAQHRVPASPLFDALAAWFAADIARAQWFAAQRIALVHRVRDLAAARLAELKRQRRVQTYDDLIDGVARALDGHGGDALVRRLRAQYAVALVDEFQDTDARQWGIFVRVFGADAPTGGDAPDDDDAFDGDARASRFLALIGDPKQAIYGFRGGDVHTYLAAARQAQPAPALDANFRSRPCLLRATAALYAAAGDDAFVDTDIRFRDVQPGGSVDDAALQRDGAIAAAIAVRLLPAPGDGRGAWKADESRALASAACVDAIRGWLADPRALIDGRRIAPADIAVLVRNHGEATRIQQGLVAAGIPAVAAGRQSLFATAQAQELLTLFDALLHPGDLARLKTALATAWLGADALTIAALDHDEASADTAQWRALAWRERWQRHGPLALIGDLCAEHASRLLGLADGERRLSNLLQLGEALQEADARALGLHGLFDWLAARIEHADDRDETQQLRLESDARRVQILTLHKSKGLEFGLVFLPFAAIGRDARPGRLLAYPDAAGRTLQLDVEHDDAHSPSRDDARLRASSERRAEDARLLYVGLTRARQALWLAGGPLYASEPTPLGTMLKNLAMAGAVDAARPAHGIVIERAADARDGSRDVPPTPAIDVPPARIARRTLSRDWWVYSFTQLTNDDAGAVDIEAGAADEPEALPLTDDLAFADRALDASAFDRPAFDAAALGMSASDRPVFDMPTFDVADFDPRFSGSRFGNVLHVALERVDFGAWATWRDGDATAPKQAQILLAALRAEGYAEAEAGEGLPLLATLVGRTLTLALPEGARLCDVAADARRAEMEFHFSMRSTPVDALLALLHAHGWLRDRQAFGARRRLEGLMTGKIDLVYAHDSRHYLLDYKSNRLAGYDAASVARAMDDSEYTLQALIYTVALHRWLRFRLGSGYEYDRDFGGVRYVFCRGLDPRDPAAGVYAAQPPRALVDAVDALFAMEVAA